MMRRPCRPTSRLCCETSRANWPASARCWSPPACICAASRRSPATARGFGHALIDDKDLASAKQALKREKIGVADTREMLVVDVTPPGGVVEVLLALAEANVNVDLSYTVCGDKLAIATDDVFNAREALS